MVLWNLHFNGVGKGQNNLDFPLDSNSQDKCFQPQNTAHCHGQYPYDMQALNWSACCIFDSLTEAFHGDVISSIGINATGQEVFTYVINKKCQLISSVQHSLIKHIEAIDTSQEEGKIVESFDINSRELIKKIEGIGAAPLVLARLVTETFMSCQVDIFKTEVTI